MKRQNVGSLELKGFYEIPGHSKYLLSRAGEVFSLESQRLLKISDSNSGYKIVRLTSDDGSRKTWGLHRLLCLVFIDPPDTLDGWVVNHKNGEKGCNEITNLEWTTYQGNSEHAGAFGLTDKCIPIEVRDVDTGEVFEYPSIVEYARKMGWSKDKVSWRIRVGETRVFPERKQYRELSPGKPWYIPKNSNREVLLNSRLRVTLVRNLQTGVISKYDSLTSAAKALSISKSLLCMWLKQENQPVLPGLIQVKYAHDEAPWREVKDVYLEYEIHNHQRVVVCTEEASGCVTYFLSARDCGVSLGLTPQLLNHRLKSKNKDRYFDGYRLEYYTDVLV